MQTTFHKLALLGMSALLITSCGGGNFHQVSYDEFHEATTKIEAHTYRSCKVNGSIKMSVSGTQVEKKYEDFVLTYDATSEMYDSATADITSANYVMDLMVVTFANVKAGDLNATDGNVKYYMGDGFKVEGESTESSDGTTTTTKMTATFDQYGYMAHLVDDTTATDNSEAHLNLHYQWSD